MAHYRPRAQQGRKRKPRRRRPARRRAASFAFWPRAFRYTAIAALWVGIAFAGMILYFATTLPPTGGLMADARGQGITIVDVEGRTIAVRGQAASPLVHVEDLPPHVTAAFLAIEDRRFYDHMGIDVWGLGRAAWTNLRAGSVVQGGSTITQQLAKNLFLSSERTFQRKVQETLLAVWLEARFTKNEILTLYLNRVYFGGGAYGIEAAAQRYFGVHATELNLQQAAMLAGLLKAPSRYSPSTNPDGAAARMEVVLNAMVEAGYLDPDARALSEGAPIAHALSTATPGSSYFVDAVMEQLPAYIGTVDGNIVVETTLDLDLQIAAEDALTRVLDRDGAARHAGQGALVAYDLLGGVTAMVGGRSYADSQFNRVTQARRSPGSAFKPFVYLTALEAGYRPDSVVLDAPVDIDGWEPANYSQDNEGFMTLSEAFSASINTVAARLGERVGPGEVLRTARRLGITSAMDPVPSIALGAVSVTPYELTAAYVPLANGGMGVLPHTILRIRTAEGRVLYERSGSGPGRVLEPRPTGDMVGMMMTAIAEGTGRNAYLQGRPNAGKTGTSQDFRDAWFVGFTGDYVAGVWIGNDNNAPMERVTGGSLPAEVWRRFMTEAHRGLPARALAGRMPAVRPQQDEALEQFLTFETRLTGS